jgi:predicted dehydrogenase
VSAYRQLRIAVVGLGFGEDFLPIYLEHPNVESVAIVEPNEGRRLSVGDRYGIIHRYADLDQLLDSGDVDAVHLATPVAFHATQSIATLDAGKHCACSVPMATTINDINAVISAQQTSGKNYMMMETSVYSREYLTVRELYHAGRLGTVTFYRGFHIQNLDGFPRYWIGYPPMLYLTHALSPVLSLLDADVATVTCRGSGRLTPERQGDYDNPFPVEVGLFELRDSNVTADIVMSFFQMARSYIEGFSVYGDLMSTEWPDREGDPLRTFELLARVDRSQGHGGASSIRRQTREEDLSTSDNALQLPTEIARFTTDTEWSRPDLPKLVEVRAHHGGSHPHLVHEFVSSIIEERAPSIDVGAAARWTAPGIIAHDSAIRGGEPRVVPQFR